MAPGAGDASPAVHAVAGSLSSMLALSAFFPLDVLRTRMQVGAEHSTLLSLLVAECSSWPSLLRLYQGLRPVLISLGVSNFVYFFAYTSLKRLYTERTARAVPTARANLLIAFCSAVANVLLTTPLWVANTRIKLQGFTKDGPRYSGLFSALSQIAAQEGVSGLWSGTAPSILLAANPTLEFVLYEQLKQRLLRRAHHGGRAGQLRGFEIMLVAALAKGVAAIATYPLQTVQNRLRAARRSQEQRQYGGIWDCLCCLVREEGPWAAFRGLDAKLLQTVAMASVKFAAYERLVQAVVSSTSGP